jgi:hypothetical protein
MGITLPCWGRDIHGTRLPPPQTVHWGAFQTETKESKVFLSLEQHTPRPHFSLHIVQLPTPGHTQGRHSRGDGTHINRPPGTYVHWRH